MEACEAFALCTMIWNFWPHRMAKKYGMEASNVSQIGSKPCSLWPLLSNTHSDCSYLRMDLVLGEGGWSADANAHTCTRLVTPVLAQPRLVHNMCVCQGKKRHIHINKCEGLSRDWVGGNIVFIRFWVVIPHGAGKHKQNPPQKISGQSREDYACVCMFFLMCFLRPQVWGAIQRDAQKLTQSRPRSCTRGTTMQAHVVANIVHNFPQSLERNRIRALVLAEKNLPSGASRADVTLPAHRPTQIRMVNVNHLPGTEESELFAMAPFQFS